MKFKTNKMYVSFSITKEAEQKFHQHWSSINADGVRTSKSKIFETMLEEYLTKQETLENNVKEPLKICYVNEYYVDDIVDMYDLTKAQAHKFLEENYGGVENDEVLNENFYEIVDQQIDKFKEENNIVDIE